MPPFISLRILYTIYRGAAYISFQSESMWTVEPITTAAKSVPVKHGLQAQSRQSTRLFLQSSELGPPPLNRRRVFPPPPLVPGRGPHLLAIEGLEGSQFGRGDKHCGTLGILCTLWLQAYGSNPPQLRGYNILFSCFRLKVYKHENFFIIFFAETESLWPQRPLTRDY
jgi:hypothetical protein